MGWSAIGGMFRFVFCLLTLIPLFPTHAQELNASQGSGPARQGFSVSNKHYIPNAIQVQISPRGLRYFQSKFRNMMVTEMDFDPSEIYLDASTHNQTEPIKIDELSGAAGDFLKLIRDAFGKYLEGFSLQDLSPQIKIGPSYIQITYEKFALHSAPNLLKSIGKTNGAVLVLEMKADLVNYTTTGLSYFDFNNPFIKAQTDETQLIIKKAKDPIRVQIPFYVEIDSSNSLHFEALGVESNFSQANANLVYNNLFTPKIKVEVDDDNYHKVYHLNNAELKNEIKRNLPPIVAQLQVLFDNWASTELPKILNDSAQKNMQKKLEEIQPLAPPGSTNPADHFYFGLQLANISQTDSVLLRLNSFIEDEEIYKDAHKAPLPKDRATDVPNIDVLDGHSYDVALGIDRGLINRILQLSFDRKFFERIPFETNKFLRLTEVPLVDPFPNNPAIGPNPKENKLLAHISLQVPEGMVVGLKKMTIRDQFELKMDVEIALREASYPDCGSQPQDKGIAILLSKIDIDSVSVDDKWLVFPLGKIFKVKVIASVRDTLKEISDKWGPKGLSIGGCFNPPNELVGLKLDMNSIGIDPSGHLLIYYDYLQTPRRSL